MRIDVHAHHLPARYVKLLKEAGGPAGAAHDRSTLKRMVEAQDAGGIDVQVLSSGPNSPYLRDPAAANVAARTINDAYKGVVDSFGGRFAAYASLPLPHAELATREALRALDELDFAGVYMGCSALGRSLDDPAYDELWCELDRREAVIYVHPGGIVVGTEPGQAGMDDPVVAVTIGSAAEIATAALRLTAVARRYQRVRVIIGLLGGSLPFLLQRVLLAAGMGKRPSALFPKTEGGGDVIALLRSFYYDVNLLPDPAVVGSAVAAYGLDRLVFGSDSPTGSPLGVREFLCAGGLGNKECDAVVEGGGRVFHNLTHV